MVHFRGSFPCIDSGLGVSGVLLKSAGMSVGPVCTSGAAAEGELGGGTITPLPGGNGVGAGGVIGAGGGVVGAGIPGMNELSIGTVG
jgi:hypothetical protein